MQTYWAGHIPPKCQRCKKAIKTSFFYAVVPELRWEILCEKCFTFQKCEYGDNKGFGVIHDKAEKKWRMKYGP